MATNTLSADFSGIRYAQCWEDADVLLAALEVEERHTCVSIASAGDNSLSLLTRSPGRVIAVDLSRAQLACLQLRMAAYHALSHGELLILIGSRLGEDRLELYRQCRSLLHEEARRFWDERPLLIQRGIGSAGKFERYWAIFRRFVLPLIHSRSRIRQLLESRSRGERETFYEEVWNNWRWQLLFRIFFSRTVLGRLGRDPSFFRYVEGSVADRCLARARYGLTELDPSENPYLHWILFGCHPSVLPHALRPENFEPIRANLDRLECRCCSLEQTLAEVKDVDRWNLSDVFEYVSEEQYHISLNRIVASSRPGARLAYWNMLAPRSRPASMDHQLCSLCELAQKLFATDRAIFYNAFVVEEVL